MSERFLSCEDADVPCTDWFMRNLVIDLLTPLIVPCPHCGRVDYQCVESTDWDYLDDDDLDSDDELEIRQIYSFYTKCDCGVRGPETTFLNRKNAPATLQDLLGTAVEAVKAWNDLFAVNNVIRTLFCTNQEGKPKKC